MGHILIILSSSQDNETVEEMQGSDLQNMLSMVMDSTPKYKPSHDEIIHESFRRAFKNAPVGAISGGLIEKALKMLWKDKTEVGETFYRGKMLEFADALGVTERNVQLEMADYLMELSAEGRL